jgi:GST-like protein
VRQAARAQLRRHWEVFADIFDAQPWLSSAGRVDDGPGALDFMAVVVSRWSGARQHLQRARPDFHALLKRLEAHERIAPVWRKHFD